MIIFHSFLSRFQDLLYVGFFLFFGCLFVRLFGEWNLEQLDWRKDHPHALPLPYGAIKLGNLIHIGHGMALRGQEKRICYVHCIPYVIFLFVDTPFSTVML